MVSFTDLSAVCAERTALFSGGHMTNSNTEFPVDLDHPLIGIGVVLVPDLMTLCQPNRCTGSFKSHPYDPTVFGTVIDVGNQSDVGFHSTWVIATSLRAAEARDRLDCIWDLYVRHRDGMTGISLEATYLGAPGLEPIMRSYTFAGAPQTGHAFVFGGEYWQSVGESGNPEDSDWSNLMSWLLGMQVDGPVRQRDLEVFFAAGQDTMRLDLAKLVIVRGTDGDVSARAFKVSLYD